MKKLNITIILLFAFLMFSACQMGDSSQMSKSQQRKMHSTFNSMQKSYKALIQEYEQDSVSMPAEMKELYSQMQNMHQQMTENHRHMMSGQKKQGMGMKQDNKQMQKRRRMRQKMQNGITREWYGQMESMHQQMARRQEQMKHPEKAKQHRQMGQGYGKMKNMIPRDNKSSDVPVNENADPTLLNGANLYTQNCSSCHGSNGEGLGDTFPPLINSTWITGDKSVPVRIVRDGLQGEIEINGDIYYGSMPSFKARLSTAEIAAIINYLRDESEGDHPDLTQDDVIEISNTYETRNRPWQPKELLGE